VESLSATGGQPGADPCWRARPRAQKCRPSPPARQRESRGRGPEPPHPESPAMTSKMPASYDLKIRKASSRAWNSSHQPRD